MHESKKTPGRYFAYRKRDNVSRWLPRSSHAWIGEICSETHCEYIRPEGMEFSVAEEKNLVFWVTVIKQLKLLYIIFQLINLIFNMIHCTNSTSQTVRWRSYLMMILQMITLPRDARSIMTPTPRTQSVTESLRANGQIYGSLPIYS